MRVLLVIAVAIAVWLLLRKGNSQPLSDGGLTGSATPALPAPSVPPAPPVASPQAGDALDNILQAIYQKEGGRPGDRNVLNNNPGDLRSARGQSGTAGGYATFNDIGDGWDALSNLVTSRVAAHPDWDFYDFFNYYLRGSTTAPSVDAQGDSDAYAEYVANYAGYDPTQTMSSALQG